MSKTEYKYLKDLCSVNQGLQIPISERHSEDGINRYFYITVQFLKDGHKEKYYVENPPVSSICDVDDIIVVRTGSTGQVITGVKGCFHNNFFKVNFDKDKILGKYLYYCLKSPEKQREMHKRAGITTIPDLNHFMFLDMKIPYFNLKKQKEIIIILDALNNKIQLNNKINDNLEAMAKTLYDYWFVQFDFPDINGNPYKTTGGKMVWNAELNRDIPEGWEVKELSEVENKIITGKTPSTKEEGNFGGEIPFVTIDDIRKQLFVFYSERTLTKKGADSQSNKYLQIGDICVSCIGTIGVIGIIGKICQTNQQINSISNVKDYNRYFLLNTLKDYFNFNVAAKKGAVLDNMNKSDFSLIPILDAPNEIKIEYYKNVQSFFFKIENNLKENQELASLRDWLLPMLMNGQLKVE